MPIRRALAAALLCTLPFAHARAAEEAAPVETVGWMRPWQPDTLLEYASEDLTTSELGEREVTRATATATVRIAEARQDGYIQAWWWRDAQYAVEAGDKHQEAAMRQFAAAMGDVTLEVDLDAGVIGLWQRVPSGAALPDDLPGTYVSDEMAAHWTITRDGDGMSLRAQGPVVRGPAWRIEPITAEDMRVHIPATVARSWLDVRIRRDASGAISELVVHGGRVKSVRYARA